MSYNDREKSEITPKEKNESLPNIQNDIRESKKYGMDI